MADPKKYAKAKSNLIRGLRKIIRESEQIARDIAWWNQHRTDAPPIDRGADLAVAHIAKQCLKLVEGDQPLPDDLYTKLLKQSEAATNA